MPQCHNFKSRYPHNREKMHEKQTLKRNPVVDIWCFQCKTCKNTLNIWEILEKVTMHLNALDKLKIDNQQWNIWIGTNIFRNCFFFFGFWENCYVCLVPNVVRLCCIRYYMFHVTTIEGFLLCFFVFWSVNKISNKAHKLVESVNV